MAAQHIYSDHNVKQVKHCIYCVWVWEPGFLQDFSAVTSGAFRSFFSGP